MSGPEHLDRERIEQLATAVMKPIVANTKRGPLSPDRVYEGLNALAAAAALLLLATNRDPSAVLFFNTALQETLEANDDCEVPA